MYTYCKEIRREIGRIEKELNKLGYTSKESLDNYAAMLIDHEERTFTGCAYFTVGKEGGSTLMDSLLAISYAYEVAKEMEGNGQTYYHATIGDNRVGDVTTRILGGLERNKLLSDEDRLFGLAELSKITDRMR